MGAWVLINDRWYNGQDSLYEAFTVFPVEFEAAQRIEGRLKFLLHIPDAFLVHYEIDFRLNLVAGVCERERNDVTACGHAIRAYFLT